MKLEPIIQVRFKRFVERYELDEHEQSKNFEIYINYLIFTSHQTDVFSLKTELFETANVGGTNDSGLDGIGIKINGSFITSKEDIKEYVELKKKMDIELFFIQSKYRPNFVASEFNTFQSGVVNAVSEDRYKISNEKVNIWLELIDYILSEDVMLLWDKKPSVRVYFVAMGEWNEDINIIAYEKKMCDDIIKMGNYEEVQVHYIDEKKILTIINNNENNFETIISIDEQISFPEVEGVSNSALVCTDSDELMKLLQTEEKIIRSSLFYDNVRAFQGDTTINSEILNTLGTTPEKFILFNNGITIVCDYFSLASRKATIKNPQIVNGCQTCNVIYNYYKSKGFTPSKIPITIKIIATENNDIVNQVVRTTNRQNIVHDEVFEITRDFHKNLENYFLAVAPIKPIHKLFYERRSKQFQGNFSIKVTQKVNLRVLTQSSVAILLEKPHYAYKHESILIKKYQNEIFLDIHQFEPYYIVSEIVESFERFFSKNPVLKKMYKTYQFQLMMIFKLVVASKMPNLTDYKKISSYCNNIREYLANPNMCEKAILDSIDIFEKTINIWTNQLGKSKFAIKDTEEFTTEITKYFSPNSNGSSNKTQNSRSGMVISVKKDKNGVDFGFIKAVPENIPFFKRMNQALDFNDLYGTLVLYDIVLDSNNKQTAHNIRFYDSNYKNKNWST